MRATIALPRRQLVDALAGGPAVLADAAGDGPPARHPVVLSLVVEALYNAGRDPSAALLGLDALVALLHADVTGPAFVPAVRRPSDWVPRGEEGRDGLCADGLGRLGRLLGCLQDTYYELMAVLTRVVQSDSTPLFEAVLRALAAITEQHGTGFLAKSDDDMTPTLVPLAVASSTPAAGPPTRLDAVVKVLLELLVRHQPAVATALGVKGALRSPIGATKMEAVVDEGGD
jgi:hypothetical protein